MGDRDAEWHTGEYPDSGLVFGEDGELPEDHIVMVTAAGCTDTATYHHLLLQHHIKLQGIQTRQRTGTLQIR